MDKFKEHTQDKYPRFLCSKAGSDDPSLSFTANVKNIIHTEIDKNRLEQLLKFLDDSYNDFLSFYAAFDGVDLYIQETLPAISFYPLKKCKTKNKALKKWFLQFEPEAINRIRSKGIAFGELGDPSNQFIFENGAVLYTQWWGDTTNIGSLNDFLNDLASNPVSVIKKLGNDVRFYDKSDSQWVPREYAFDE